MATFGKFVQISQLKKKLRKDPSKGVYILDRYLFQLPKRISVPPLPVVEKTVYIRVGCGGHTVEKMDWYEFKLSNDPSSSSSSGRKRKRKGGKLVKIEPIGKDVETSWFGCCVALGGSTIYCIGGGEYFNRPSPKVSATDAVGVGVGGQWRQVTQMKASRAEGAKAVTAENKIYVFGGLCDYKSPEIEVFDPIKKTWESVEQPPLQFDLSYDEFFVTYDDASKKIITGSYSSRVLLAYDVTKGSSEEDPWEVLNTRFKIPPIYAISEPVLFGNALCWIHITDRGIGKVVEIFLYDMDLKMSACAPISGFDLPFHDQNRIYRPLLFHFRGGNEFYFIWLDVICLCRRSRSVIRCTRILVSKLFDKQKQRIRVKAYALSSNTYLLPKYVNLMDAVVL